MPKAICYVVPCVFNGTKYYLEREEVGLLDPKTMKPIREPMGFFCPDLIHALKWTKKDLAEMVCAGYDEAHVETIKEGEVLL